jgi:plastocyanin
MRLMTRVVLVAIFGVCAPVGIPASASGAASHSVTISGFAFSPSAITITVGDTVTWTNQDVAPHDVTTTDAPVAIHSSTMSKGQSWSYTFTRSGRYAYICSIHPDMKATLVVLAAPRPKHTARTTAPTRVPRHVAGRAATSDRSPRTHGAVAASTAEPLPAGVTTRPSEPPVTQSASVASSDTRALRPLLIVAGIIAAVTTLALLMLASRPEDGG